MGQKESHHTTPSAHSIDSNRTNTIQQPVLPTLTSPKDWHSQFLTDDIATILANALPQDYRLHWKLLYSSPIHGKSFNRFCYHVTGHGPTIIFIRDRGGTSFGGYADHMWREKHPKFYGNGTGFVFSLRDQRIYRATGQNDHYQWLNQGTMTLFNGVGMGGQERFFAWAIDDSFDTGTCRGTPNTTFGCPILSSSPDWDVDVVEVWEVREPATMTYEQEKLMEKKNKTKSVLEDDDNADKVIQGMMGHEFSHEEKPPDVKK